MKGINRLTGKYCSNKDLITQVILGLWLDLPESKGVHGFGKSIYVDPALSCKPARTIREGGQVNKPRLWKPAQGQR